MLVQLRVVLQDIIEDDEIKLDWFFKASMISDLVNVSSCNLLLSEYFTWLRINTIHFHLVYKSRDIHGRTAQCR